MSDLELAVVRVLADAATTFAMELATPDLVGLADVGPPRAFPGARRARGARRPPARPPAAGAPFRSPMRTDADELLATAALWAAFTGD